MRACRSPGSRRSDDDRAAARTRHRADPRPADPALALLLRGLADADSVLRRSRRPLEGTAAGRARARKAARRALAAVSPLAGLAGHLRRDLGRPSARRLVGGSLRQARCGRQHRAGLHLGRLLARPRPDRRVVRECLDPPEPLECGCRRRRLGMGEARPGVGASGALPGAARALDCSRAVPRLRDARARLAAVGRAADARARDRLLQQDHQGRDADIRQTRQARKPRGVRRGSQPSLSGRRTAAAGPSSARRSRALPPATRTPAPSPSSR